MKKFIISILILFIAYQLGGITEGGEEGKHDRNIGQAEVAKTVGHEKDSDNTLYNQAIIDFQSGNYSSALDKFRMILQQEPDESPRKEKVLRCIADCHFFLGLKGNNNDLLSAVDFYKNILQKYPGSRGENAVALYRVAKSYAALNFYYEAKREYENLYALYPESSYVPESVFRMGEMLYKSKKFGDAAEKFEEYIRKFPEGEYIKTAYFNLGDCYSQIHQEEKADRWYQGALKRWPDLGNIPEDILLNLGFHYFKSQKYPDTLKIFFFYINVYPESESYKEVLFVIARSFMELGQLSLSLKMFSILTEKFPNSREATESAIIMANIGVKKPGMKLPFYFHGMQNYRDPLKTYNDTLARSPSGEYSEELLFQKGFVLYNKGRYKESFDTCGRLLRQFPQGKYRGEAFKYFLATTELLVDENYAKGDYPAVSEIYFKSRENGLISGDYFKMAYKMGDSLRRVGLYDEAMEVFEKLLKTCGSITDRHKTILAIADVDCERGNYENVERVLKQLSITSLDTDRRLTPRGGKSRYKMKAMVKPVESEGNIEKHVNRILGNVYFKKGQFDKAAQAYAKVLDSGVGIEGMAVVYRNYAECLKMMKSLSMAINNYQKAIEVYNRESQKYPINVMTDSYRGIGDCLLEEKKYPEAISMYKQSLTKSDKSTEGLWSIYNMGQGYVELRNSEMADKTFSELKNKGGEGFWSTLADYALREYSWNDKYTASQN
ncbi:MAG TPA: tetratricopeptide repeat protein [Syntrophales bacterium]|nr:tetratricopeptide repeat protein [Syntrophales bacterium]